MVGYRDIAEHYRALILAGRLRTGEALPSVRDVARQFEVTDKTAHHALTELRMEELVRSTPRGFEVTYRVETEATLRVPIDGPRLRGFLPADDVVRTITHAGLNPTPEPIAGMFGIRAGALSVLREGQILRDGRVIGYTMSRFPAQWAERVPELLHALSTPPGSVARIEAVLGHPTQVALDRFEPDVASHELAELFQVPPGDPVMIRTTISHDRDGIIEYGQAITARGVKIENVYRRD